MKALSKHREIWLALAILLVLVLVTARFPRFAQPGNLLAIFNDTSILMMLALGQMAVILTRSIDLSMASNLALTGMIVAMVNAAFPGVPIPLLIAGCIVVGGALGAFNGILVWKLNIPPIVVTLGTLTIYRGLVFVISGGNWVNAADMTPDFISLQRTIFLGLPLLSWFAIIVAVLFFVVMTRTPLGRSLYAIGVNPTASRVRLVSIVVLPWCEIVVRRGVPRPLVGAPCMGRSETGA
jgi:rhamnose transport system permease protein